MKDILVRSRVSFSVLPCRYVCRCCEYVCWNLTRTDVKWWLSPRQRLHHLCIAMPRPFHSLRPLCWRIQLERRGHPVRIVMHSNRTNTSKHDIAEREQIFTYTRANWWHCFFFLRRMKIESNLKSNVLVQKEKSSRRNNIQCTQHIINNQRWMYTPEHIDHSHWFVCLLPSVQILSLCKRRRVTGSVLNQ